MRKEIAHAMGLGEETVRNHLSRARYRLRALNTTHAVAIAIRRGII
jgi:DNA-binding CsgD family transcriptional regulator